MGKGRRGGLQWPVKNRGCTDVICCFLFLIFIVVFVAVAIWSYVIADPRLLLVPVDSRGAACGFGDREDRPFLFFFDLTRCATSALTLATSGCNTPQVCVKECPTDNYVYFPAQESVPNNQTLRYCRDSADRSQTVGDLVTSDQCPAYYVKSKEIANRCVPEVLSWTEGAGLNITDVNNETLRDSDENVINSTTLMGATETVRFLANVKRIGTRILHDLETTWTYILVFLGAALLVSLAWVLLLRFVAGIIVWLVIFLFTIVFVVATTYCFLRYFELRDFVEADVTSSRLQQFAFLDVDYVLRQANTWLALGIISAVILLIALLVILFLWKRLRIAVAVIKQTSNALGTMMSVLLWPLVPLVLQIGFMTIAFSSFLHIIVLASGRDNIIFNFNNDTNSSTAAQADTIIQDIPCDPEANGTLGRLCRFVKFGEGTELSIYVLIYQVFVWVWIWNFISALSELVLAGCFASHYWAFRKPDDLPAVPLLGSVSRAFRYHLGSVAFGSLIIAILRIIQVILEYIRRKFETHRSSLADFLLKCLICCFNCLEKIMLFINRYAYIVIAIKGSNFCSSAKEAFSLILDNILRVAVVDGISWFLLFLCKITVTVGISVLAGFFFSQNIEVFDVYVRDLAINYYVIPVIVVVIGSFTIANELFTVYKMGVNTIFVSFLADLKHNDGSVEKPYYMSKELMGILHKKNVKAPVQPDENVM